MSLILLTNAASRYLRSGKLQGVMSLILLAVLIRSANDAGASTASQSGRTSGNAASSYLEKHADNEASAST